MILDCSMFRIWSLGLGFYFAFRDPALDDASGRCMYRKAQRSRLADKRGDLLVHLDGLS